MFSTPATPATQPAIVNAIVRCNGDVEAERRHAHRVVAHALESEAEWRPRQAPKHGVRSHRQRHAQVVEANRVAVEERRWLGCR